jgi:hypothetical protein
MHHQSDRGSHAMELDVCSLPRFTNSVKSHTNPFFIIILDIQLSDADSAYDGS